MNEVKYVQRATKKDISEIATKFKLTEVQSNLMASRIDDKVLEEFDYEANDLINSKFDPMKNIDRLPDIHEAGEVIAQHIKEKNHILIVCDFDSDFLRLN